MVTIPQDIIDTIIDAVGDNRRLLQKCALVSSSFLFPSRKHLFSQLSLTGRRSDQAYQRLHQVLVENPVVQSFVRSITIGRNWKAYERNHASLITILRLPFCCLESFSIENWSSMNWDDFSSELKDALSTVIHSSTLKTLYLVNVSLPIMVFLGINLSKLELIDSNTNLSKKFNGEQSWLLIPAALKATISFHTVVDHCVWTYYGRVHGPPEPIFLPFMCRLHVLEIYINPCYATITGATKQIEYNAFNDDLRDADCWSHLDSIISHPTGTRLERVHIDIEYFIRRFQYDGDDDVVEPVITEVSEPVLDALPLLHEKAFCSSRPRSQPASIRSTYRQFYMPCQP